MGMNINEVYKLAQYFENSKLSKFELELDDVKLKLEKESVGRVSSNAYDTMAAPTNAASTEVSKNALETPVGVSGTCVKAPLVGTFYRSSSPEDKPFISVGDSVKEGDVVGIIEAMKLMNEIVAPASGIIESIEVTDGDMVEYDQVIMTIKES